MVRKSRKQELSQKQRSLVAHYDQKSPVSEQYRTLRTNIQFASVDKKVKTIMVTSATPGDGKSTTAANLGIVLAQQQKKVLLVDADLRKPTSHYTFELPNQVGLTNVLTKQINLEGAVSQTQIPYMDLLTSGPLPPNPSELLGSKAMGNFVERLDKHYDYIIIDTPPVNAVTDPQVLSQHCDGVIVVVRSGKTEQEAIKKAVDSLRKVGADILGSVLNSQKQSESNYYYYYGESK